MDKLNILKKVSLGEATLKEKGIIERLPEEEFNILINKLKTEEEEKFKPEFNLFNIEDKKIHNTNNTKKLKKSVKSDKAFSYVSKRITAIKTVNKLKGKSE